MYEPNRPDFLLFTVPHSGTRFTMEYFRHLGWKSWNPSNPVHELCWWQQHSGDWVDRTEERFRSYLYDKKVIVTVQHPHRCWVSFLSRGKTFEQNIYCWKSLLEWLSKIDHVIFDINCPEDQRSDQLKNVLRHVGQDNRKNIESTEYFVRTNWVPSHPKDSQHKRDYLRERKLPEGYDYSKLQFAVDWYESLPSNNC